MSRILRDGWFQCTAAVALFAGLIGYAVPAAKVTPATPIAPAHRPECRVDPAGGADFKTLEEALAQARAGDLIRLAPGLHAATVKIDKALRLAGEGSMGQTTVIGVGAHTLWISGAAVEVKNLVIGRSPNNGSHALEVSAGAQLTLTGGQVTGGTRVTRDGQLVADGTSFSDRQVSLVVVDGGSAELVRATFSGWKDCLLVDGAGSRARVSDAVFKTCERAVTLRNGGDATLESPRYENCAQTVVRN